MVERQVNRREMMKAGLGGASVAAALAAKKGCLPQQLKWEQVEKALSKFNNTLP